MELNEKIDFEYQCFFLDQMRTSKENIFAHSEEIECKKKLKAGLEELAGRLDRRVREYLSVQENLLESAFRFLQDTGWDGASALDAKLEEWLAFVQK